MTNNRVAFEHYEGNTSELVAYKEITGQLIFDVKLSDKFRIRQGLLLMGIYSIPQHQ